MDSQAIEWSRLFGYKRAIHKRFKSVWDIPLLKKRSDLLKRILKDGMSLLDVGAGMRGMEEEIAKLGFNVEYKSMDVDRSNRHDYYDVGEISQRFDVVGLFEVIEHVSLEEGLRLLKGLSEVTREGGMIIISTPNIFNPARFMRDSTHRTFYSYEELCGLMNMAGFEIDGLFRSYNDAFHRYILKVHLFGFLFRFLSIDYANSIYAVGRKTASRAPGNSPARSLP